MSCLSVSEINSLSLQLFGVVLEIPESIPSQDFTITGWEACAEIFRNHYTIFTPTCLYAIEEITEFVKILRAREHVSPHEPLFSITNKALKQVSKTHDPCAHTLAKFAKISWGAERSGLVSMEISPSKEERLLPLVITSVSPERLRSKCCKLLKRNHNDPQARLPENEYLAQSKYISMSLDILNFLGVQMESNEITNPTARFVIIWRHLETGAAQVINESMDDAHEAQIHGDHLHILSSKAWQNFITNGDFLSSLQKEAEEGMVNNLYGTNWELFQSNFSAIEIAYPYDPRNVLSAAVVVSGAPCRLNSFLEYKKDKVNYIKDGKLEISEVFTKFGLERLATIFHRYQELFLAFKEGSVNNKKIVNRISHLSQQAQEPNPLDMSRLDWMENKEILKWLDNTTALTLLKPNTTVSSCTLPQLWEAVNKPWTKPDVRKRYNITHINNQAFQYYLGNRLTNFQQCNAFYYYVKSVCESGVFAPFLKSLRYAYSIFKKRVYIPKEITYSLIKSEDEMIGNLPLNSSVSIPRPNKAVFGIFTKCKKSKAPVTLFARSNGGALTAKKLKNRGFSINQIQEKSTDGFISTFVYLTINHEQCKQVDGFSVLATLSANTRCDVSEIVLANSKKSNSLETMLHPNNVIVKGRIDFSKGLKVVGKISHKEDSSKITICNKRWRKPSKADKNYVSPARFYKSSIDQALVIMETSPTEGAYDLSIEKFSYDAFINLFDEFGHSII